MFKKLRRHFLLLNMMMMSLVLIVSFVGVYTAMRQSVMRENLHRLDAIDVPFEVEGHFEFGARIEGGVDAVENLSVVHIRTQAFENYFRIFLNEDGELIARYMSVELEENQYMQAVGAIGNRAEGLLNLAGRDWVFTVVGNHAGSVVTFLDVTESIVALASLFPIFLIVGAVLLIVVLFISLAFSKYTVAPIELSFNKQKQFIADASHELKTPLAIINANVDAMTTSDAFIFHIKQQTYRMTHLVESLLELTCHDVSKNNHAYERINISQVTIRTVLTMEAIAYEKGFTFEDEIAEDIYALADLAKVEQILTILLDNALKYGEASRPIRVSLSQRSKWVVCSVSNQVADDIVNPDRLFDRFYREDAARVHVSGGYGLGLSIAQSIVDGLGGRISVSSENGEVTFTFMLPNA